MKYANQTIPYVVNVNYVHFVNLIKTGDRIFPPSNPHSGRRSKGEDAYMTFSPFS